MCGTHFVSETILTIIYFSTRIGCLGDVFYVWFLGTYVSSLLDHDIIKYMMIFFPHYLGCLLYFLNRPCMYYILFAYVYQLCFAGSRYELA